MEKLSEQVGLLITTLALMHNVSDGWKKLPQEVAQLEVENTEHLRQITVLEAVVMEQNKLLEKFRRKLDKLEQETICELEDALDRKTDALVEADVLNARLQKELGVAST